MRTALMLALVAIGFVVAMKSVVAALLCWGAAFAIHRGASVADEQAFVAVLMLLAGLGAAVMIGEYAWQRITALL